jgi:hypothetical protein
MELNFKRCMDAEEQATTWCRPSSVEHHEDDDDDEGAIIAMAKAAISELKMMSKNSLARVSFVSRVCTFCGPERQTKKSLAVFISFFFTFYLFIEISFHLIFHFVFRNASLLPSVFFLGVLVIPCGYPVIPTEHHEEFLLSMFTSFNSHCVSARYPLGIFTRRK